MRIQRFVVAALAAPIVVTTVAAVVGNVVVEDGNRRAFLMAIAIAVSLALAAAFSRELLLRVRSHDDALQNAVRRAATSQELMADISHDLRNPVHAIGLVTSLLRTTVAAADQQRLDAIEHATERITKMLDDIAYNQPFDRGAIVLSRTGWTGEELLRDAIEMFRPVAYEHGISLHSELDAVGTLYADRERVLRVLSNLIGNAVKFVGAGGAVTVRMRKCDGSVRFEVADTGPGIPASEQPVVFDRYYQRRSSRSSGESGSFGLGLSIAKRLVEAHRGQIGVESEVGHGATFWFSLPTEPTVLL
jgi:signal transduction histidine kinase